MQVLVPGMHLHAASPFPAAYFDASLGAGDALKRSQPRETVRRGPHPPALAAISIFKHNYCHGLGLGQSVRIIMFKN